MISEERKQGFQDRQDYEDAICNLSSVSFQIDTCLFQARRNTIAPEILARRYEEMLLIARQSYEKTEKIAKEYGFKNLRGDVFASSIKKEHAKLAEYTAFGQLQQAGEAR